MSPLLHPSPRPSTTATAVHLTIAAPSGSPATAPVFIRPTPGQRPTVFDSVLSAFRSVSPPATRLSIPASGCTLIPSHRPRHHHVEPTYQRPISARLFSHRVIAPALDASFPLHHPTWPYRLTKPTRRLLGPRPPVPNANHKYDMHTHTQTDHPTSIVRNDDDTALSSALHRFPHHPIIISFPPYLHTNIICGSKLTHPISRLWAPGSHARTCAELCWRNGAHTVRPRLGNL